VLHINEGTDGTLEWAQSEGLKFTYTKNNVGVCESMNAAFSISSRKQTIYFNDDMFALPSWDVELALFASARDIGTNEAFISSTMIEPRGDNPCCLAPRDYGQSIETFRESDLIKDLTALREQSPNRKGSTWPPCIVSRDNWIKVGGYSTEFSPGFGSDPDLAKKLYDVGIRKFVGVGRSLVYHFICKTTKVKNFVHNNGDATFERIHGMSIGKFVHNVLHRGEECND
jgi:hypothetical protein